MDIYFYSGGKVAYDKSPTRNDILEYNPETKEWTQIGTMREDMRRSGQGHAVSVVKYEDYLDFCQ